MRLKFDVTRDHHCVDLRIVMQAEDLRCSIDAWDSLLIFESPEHGWKAVSAGSPEIDTGGRKLFIRGSETDEDDKTAHACFNSDAQVEVFLDFIRVLELNINGGTVAKKKAAKTATIQESKGFKASRFVKVDFDEIKDRKKRAYAQKLSSEGRLIELVAYLRSLEGVQSPWNFDINKLNKVKGTDKLSTKKAGFFIELYNKRFDIFANHAPSKAVTGFGRYLGIEIECLIPRTADYRSSESFAAWIKDKSGQKIKYLSVVDDGSLRPGDGFFSVELRLLTMKDDFSNLKQTCDLLRTIGAKVNKSCGLHVHLDMRQPEDDVALDTMNLKARRIGNSLDILKLMIPSSRRENSFCKLSVGRVDSSDRYYAVNKSSFNKHKTLEIRLHSGTTNYKKIKNWCELLLALAECKKLSRNHPETVERFFELSDLNEELKAYVLERIQTFTEPSESEADEMPPQARFERGRNPGDPFLTCDVSVPANQMREEFVNFAMATFQPSMADRRNADVARRAEELYAAEVSSMRVTGSRHVFRSFNQVRDLWQLMCRRDEDAVTRQVYTRAGADISVTTTAITTAMPSPADELYTISYETPNRGVARQAAIRPISVPDDTWAVYRDEDSEQGQE